MPTAAEAALIVGCGDIGTRLARRLQAQGQPVIALVRSPASAQALEAMNIEAQAFDLDAGDEPVLPAAAQVYWFAPPPARGAQDARLRRALPALHGTRRLVYLSTSAVYGDCGGRWIDEDEPLKLQSERGQRRLDAENAAREWSQRSGAEVMTLRVPGIYGPGRLPLERLRQNLPVIQDSADEAQRRWTNRIHAEDLAAAAQAAMQRGIPGAAYNISDGHPTTMSDYFSRCARLLGLPEPPRVTMDEARLRLTPSMLSFLEESKRLRNYRMLGELGVVLRYPDLEAGLPSCV